MKVIRTDKNGNEIAEVSVTELDTMFKEIRAKAIDEFAERLKEKYGCLGYIDEIKFEEVDNIAEQMKAGGLMGRLIDANANREKFKEIVYRTLNDCNITTKKKFNIIMTAFDNMPTAYDVEKVVAELEDKIKDVEKIIVTPPQDKLDEIANDIAEDFIGAWESAIKVVRKGGVE